MKTAARLAAEEGVTLAEILVTVAILGVAFVALVGGMGSAILASDIHRKQATGGAAVRAYAEAIKAASYAECGTAGSYAPAAVGYSAPAGFTAAVTGVEYWRADGSDPNTGDYVATCTADQGLQRVSLQVASDDARATESIQIVKRSP